MNAANTPPADGAITLGLFHLAIKTSDLPLTRERLVEALMSA